MDSFRRGFFSKRAVDQPKAWQLANTYGFMVDRITILRDGKKVMNPNRRRLSIKPVLPRPAAEWKEVVQRNDRAAIIAQSLFGERFNVTDGASSQKDAPATLFAQSDELNQRFTFALMSADQSFEAAQLAGWAWVDSTAKANEQYLYVVYANVPKAQIAIDTAGAFIGLKDYKELPKPLELTASFGNKSVLLTWDNRTYRDIYSSYYVERSEDSVTFAKATNLPVTNLNRSGEAASNSMVYADSLSANDKIYYYRVRGITSFGETSPPSVFVKGMGSDEIILNTNIVNTEILADSLIRLDWELLNDSMKNATHFDIAISNDADGVFTPLKQNIDINSRTITLKSPLATTYFVVSVLDKKGHKYNSLPQMVQLEDATPPAIPVGLRGEINDSTGKVTLTWEANTDIDLEGYHVFRCNVVGEEMSLLTDKPFKSETFIDSVDLKMLNSKVYYAIAALDHRYNASKKCKIVELVKPDKIAPPPLVFTNYKVEENQVILTWETSTAEDLAAQRLYRRDAQNPTNEAAWELIKEFTGRDSTTYADEKVVGGRAYAYTLMATDKSKNESDPSVPLTITVPIDKKNKAAVRDLKAEANRQVRQINVSWVYAESGVVEYQIYKTTKNAPFSLWKVMEKNELAIIDPDVSAGNVYRYAVRAVFGDGSQSVWKEVKVEF